MTTLTATPRILPDKSTNVRSSQGAPTWVRASFSTASRLAPGLTSSIAARLFRNTRRSSPRPGERGVLQDAEAWRLAGMQLWAWGEGPTVLLVHGWNGRGTQLGAVVAPLVARGYRVVAFDALGHGESEGKRSSLPELASCIRQVVEELGGVYGVIAHSLGGAATTYSLAHGLDVERAVFISPPADPREFLRIFGEALGIDDDVRARVKERVERRLGVPMEQMQTFAIAPAMQIPLLVIHDEDDKEVPFSVGKAIAEAWPGADLMVTHGLGHQRILRDETVRDAAVGFIDAAMHRQAAA